MHRSILLENSWVDLILTERECLLGEVKLLFQSIDTAIMSNLRRPPVTQPVNRPNFPDGFPISRNLDLFQSFIWKYRKRKKNPLRIWLKSTSWTQTNLQFSCNPCNSEILFNWNFAVYSDSICAQDAAITSDPAVSQEARASSALKWIDCCFSVRAQCTGALMGCSPALSCGSFCQPAGGLKTCCRWCSLWGGGEMEDPPSQPPPSSSLYH